MYRRPSALGVPDYRFSKSSEYLANYEERKGHKNDRFYKARPKTNGDSVETGNEGQTEGMTTQNQVDFVGKKSEENIDWVTATKQENEVNTNNAKHLRPRSKLKPEGQIEWGNKPEPLFVSGKFFLHFQIILGKYTLICRYQKGIQTRR